MSDCNLWTVVVRKDHRTLHGSSVCLVEFSDLKESYLDVYLHLVSDLKQRSDPSPLQNLAFEQLEFQCWETALLPWSKPETPLFVAVVGCLRTQAFFKFVFNSILKMFENAVVGGVKNRNRTVQQNFKVFMRAWERLHVIPHWIQFVFWRIQFLILNISTSFFDF